MKGLSIISYQIFFMFFKSNLRSWLLRILKTVPSSCIIDRMPTNFIKKLWIFTFKHFTIFLKPFLSLKIFLHLEHILAVSLELFEFYQDRIFCNRFILDFCKSLYLFSHQIDINLISMRFLKIYVERKHFNEPVEVCFHVFEGYFLQILVCAGKSHVTVDYCLHFLEVIVTHFLIELSQHGYWAE